MEKENILQSLYGEVFVPPAVAEELARGAANFPSIHRVLNAPWLVMRSLNSPQRAAELGSELDAGEAEAIALCQELHAGLLLVDDQEARRMAKRLGIPQIGLLGILLEAKSTNLLGGPLKPVFEQLLKLGFRASPQLIATLLKEAGE